MGGRLQQDVPKEINLLFITSNSSVPRNSAETSAECTTSASGGDSENKALRRALQENLVTFPAQIPIFKNRPRPDLQSKIVVLYFVRGWTMTDIAIRYKIARQRVGQIITAWRTRAVMEGYVQKVELESPPLLPAPSDQLHEANQVPVSASPLNSTYFPPNAAIYREQVERIPTFAGGAKLIDKLQAIADVLRNQLRLCSQPRFVGNRHSCDQLLTCAKELCARLEFYMATTPPGAFVLEPGFEEAQAEAVLARARALITRFRDDALGRPVLAPRPQLKNATKSGAVRLLVSPATKRNEPQGVRQIAAVGS